MILSTTPDFGGFLPTILLFVAIIVSVTLFLVHEFIIMPPIARRMRRAKWSRCSPGFIQDDAGRVHFVINDIELPEGIVHNKRGWFLKSRPPYIPEESEEEDKKKKGRRGPKQQTLSKKQEEVLETILEVPVLEGLGKGCFFGYDGSPLLANLKTLASANNKIVQVQKEDRTVDYVGKVTTVVTKWIGGHADLRIFKEIIPATISRTQLGNLHRWSLNKGYEKRGGDTMKFLILIAGLVCLVACIGIVGYILLQA